MIKKITISLILAVATASYAGEVSNQASTAKQQQTSNLAQVYDLFEVMHIRDNYEKLVKIRLSTISRMLPPEIKNDPEMKKKYIKILSDFISENMNWDKIKEDMAKIYANNYTSEEMKDLKKFYVSDTGQKVLKTLPKISKETMQMVQTKMMSHMGELQEKIVELLKSKTPKK